MECMYVLFREVVQAQWLVKATVKGKNLLPGEQILSFKSSLQYPLWFWFCKKRVWKAVKHQGKVREFRMAGLVATQKGE